MMKYILLIAMIPVLCLAGSALATYLRLKKEPWRNDIAKGLKSPNQWCRWFGCTGHVPREGYYSGMPQAHCYYCGARCYSASEGTPDYKPNPNTESVIWRLGVPLARLLDRTKK